MKKILIAVALTFAFASFAETKAPTKTAKTSKAKAAKAEKEKAAKETKEAAPKDDAHKEAPAGR